MRATVTHQFDAKVKAVRKARNPEKEEVEFVTEELDIEVKCPTGAKPRPLAKPEDAPMVTLRSLMPGSARSADPNDHSLNEEFRADSIEFLVVRRKAEKDEVDCGQPLEDINEAAWEIPSEDVYDNIMGHAIGKFTEEDPELIHVLCWSSINQNTETGVFKIKTGDMHQIHTFRAIIRNMILDDTCFDTFPKLAIIKKYQLSAYFPKNTKPIKTPVLLLWLVSCNRGLCGSLRSVEVRYYPEGHPRYGARIVAMTGTPEFMDSLQHFPKDFPFSITMANVFIRGGTRSDESHANARRPKISEVALQGLIKRNMAKIIKGMNLSEDDKLAEKLRGTNIAPPKTKTHYPVNIKKLLTPLLTTISNIPRPIATITILNQDTTFFLIYSPRPRSNAM